MQSLHDGATNESLVGANGRAVAPKRAEKVTDPEGRARGGCWCHLRRKLFAARTETGDLADVEACISATSCHWSKCAPR